MKRLLTLICLLALVISSGAEELSVAAAADLNFAMKEIAKTYHDETGNTLKVSYGSSGNFFVQLQNGAPFDLFFSADVDFPRQLQSAGLGEPGTLYKYAVGKIVVWVPNGSKLNVAKGLNLLVDPAVRKIAIANPKHAPYGRAAESALKKAGIYDRVKDRLVLGESVSQAAQFVDTGNADVGIIALSLAISPTMKSRGHFFEVPVDLYPPLEQGAIVIRSSQKKDAAKQFVDFLRRPECQTILRSYGFSPPD